MRRPAPFNGMRLMRRVRCRDRIAFLASIGVHVDSGSHGRRDRIVDRMLVCSRTRCECADVDEFTCECTSPFVAERLGFFDLQPLTRRERRRPACVDCGAPMHGVRR